MDFAFSLSSVTASPAAPAPSSPAPRENLLANLVCTIAAPALILSKLSAPERLGPALALVVALAFPVGYGLWDFSRRRRFNFIAGIGFATLGFEAADQLADDLARRVGVERDAMRSAVRDTLEAWRTEAERLGDRRDEAIERAFAKTGLVRREEIDDLALRVAQLEHRIRLLEHDPEKVAH